jgi:glutamyl-tRNA synthetase
MEDLTTEAVAGKVGEQLRDLASLGIDHDGEVVFQSERAHLYADVIAELDGLGLTYPCFCTRKEIRAEVDSAGAAPHGDSPEGAYPGTCSGLSSVDQERRMAERGRAALRVRASATSVAFVDRINGGFELPVDDFVLRRWDGTAAYNLAVVVDDHDQGVTQVARGDDLLGTTHRQVFLQSVLGYAVPEYVHVPLVLGPDGERLAKRHGAVTLSDLRELGVTPVAVLAAMAGSIGIDSGAVRGASRAPELTGHFSLDRLPREPWVFDPQSLGG